MIQANNDNFGRSFVLDRSVQVTDPSDTEMATKTPHKFHAILCDKLETVLRNQQMELREQQMVNSWRNWIKNVTLTFSF